MCTSNTFPSALVPYGLKMQAPMGGMGSPYPAGITPGAALELQRTQAAQLYDYSARIRLGLHYAAAAAGHPGFNPYQPAPHDPFALMYAKHCDPRMRFLHEEPKPSHSYIGLIGMGILSNKDQKMVLSDIYQHILDNYAYFRTRGPGWRNSIRHNLSLNDCFIKSGRSANGKGHYWAIHPANVEDFKKGDFRRRRAQRKVRKAMGLAVPDDEDSPSPPPQIEQSGPPIHWAARVLGDEGTERIKDEPAHDESFGDSSVTISPGALSPVSDGKRPREESHHDDGPVIQSVSPRGRCDMPPGLARDGAPPTKKRMFDVDSLLAPDTERVKEQDSTDLRAPAPLTYFGRPFPGVMPHPGLIPPSHILQRDLIHKNLQLHKALLSAGHKPFFTEPEDHDLSRPLEIDTSRDTDSENIDITSPGSPEGRQFDHKGSNENSPVSDKQHPDMALHPCTSGSPLSKDNSSPEYALPKIAMPATSWIPVPMIPGPWKDHPSAFRNAMLPGHRSMWGALAAGGTITPAGPGKLRLPTTGSR